MILALHLLCVGGGSAGPLIAMWFAGPARQGDHAARVAAVRLAWLSVASVSIGVLWGLAAALLLWTPAYATVLRRLESRIFYGVIELAFSLLLFILYALWWQRLPRTRWKQVSHSLLAILASTNLLYHFPLLFITIADLSASGAGSSEPIGSAQFRELIFQPWALARAVHFALAGLAIAGVAAMLCVPRERIDTEQASTPEAPQATTAASRIGARVALVATLLQVATGMWIIGQMPASAQQQILGRDTLASLLLLLSIAAALALLHSLAELASGTARPQLVHRSAALVVFVMLAMTGASRRAQPQPNPAADSNAEPAPAASLAPRGSHEG